MTMSKRIGAMVIALTVLSWLGLSTPSQAGTWMITLETPGAAATSLDVQFTDIGRTILDVGNYTFLGLAGGVSESVTPIPVANGIGFAFSPMLPASVTEFRFTLKTDGNEPHFAFANWFNGTTLVGDPPGQVVPEPASMVLLGIGMIGILSCRRLSKRKAS